MKRIYKLQSRLKDDTLFGKAGCFSMFGLRVLIIGSKQAKVGLWHSSQQIYALD